MKQFAILITFFALASCGADGDPIPTSEPGVSISGDARIGIVG